MILYLVAKTKWWKREAQNKDREKNQNLNQYSSRD